MVPTRSARPAGLARIFGPPLPEGSMLAASKHLRADSRKPNVSVDLQKGLRRVASRPKLAASAASILIGSIISGMAAAFPDRAIVLIVPFAAGGSTDVVSRIMAAHMSRTLGQQIVIETVA